MDPTADLVEQLSGSFTISQDKNDTASPHPRLSGYKSRSTFEESQDKRRQSQLEAQKRRRVDAVDYARKLVNGELDSEDLESMEIETEEIRFNPFKYQLMLSEWLVEAPNDLEENWFMTVCPVGKRCLVVANRSNTSAYTKSGYCVMRFPSRLPGGSLNHFKYGEHTILDCVYDEIGRTFYVLDVMCWRGHPSYDSETDFRFFWLRTKLEEEPELQVVSKKNPYKFIPIPCVTCSTEAIQKAITQEYPFKIDGLLFYHRQLTYRPGRTPLVGWLKAHMIPEILSIPLPESVTKEAPLVNKLTLMKANSDLDFVSDKKTKKEKRSKDAPME